MPDEYVAYLESVAAITDPDVKRNTENMARLSAMKEFNKRVN